MATNNSLETGSPAATANSVGIAHPVAAMCFVGRGCLPAVVLLQEGRGPVALVQAHFVVEGQSEVRNPRPHRPQSRQELWLGVRRGLAPYLPVPVLVEACCLRCLVGLVSATRVGLPQGSWVSPHCQQGRRGPARPPPAPAVRRGASPVRRHRRRPARAAAWWPVVPRQRDLLAAADPAVKGMQCLGVELTRPGDRLHLHSVAAMRPGGRQPGARPVVLRQGAGLWRGRPVLRDCAVGRLQEL